MPIIYFGGRWNEEKPPRRRRLRTTLPRYGVIFYTAKIYRSPTFLNRGGPRRLNETDGFSPSHRQPDTVISLFHFFFFFFHIYSEYKRRSLAYVYFKVIKSIKKYLYVYFFFYFMRKYTPKFPYTCRFTILLFSYPYTS